MSPWYRTYDADWNRTGHVDRPQYPGHMPAGGDMDFPIACRACGGEIVGVLGATLVGVDIAYCAKGHRITLEKIGGS